MWLLNKSTAKISSRQQIAIKEVRDGILILPGNEYRVVLETSSVNFELLSEAEQDVLIDGFQSFLNSLPCKLQILVRVREVDIDHYLAAMERTKNNETLRIYKDQINNYSRFINDLVSGNKILSRRFYIVIPYHPEEKRLDFSVIKEQLYLNRDVVVKGTEKLGMKAKQLDSLELLELFYGFYNPDQIKTQELKGHTIQTLINQNNA